jgi:hypothetical protein
VFFIVAGTWLFGEHLPADPVRLVLRLGGIAIAGTVVVLLSRRPSQAEAALLPAMGTEPVAPGAAVDPADCGRPMMGAA